MPQYLTRLTVDLGSFGSDSVAAFHYLFDDTIEEGLSFSWSYWHHGVRRKLTGGSRWLRWGEVSWREERKRAAKKGGLLGKSVICRGTRGAPRVRLRHDGYDVPAKCDSLGRYVKEQRGRVVESANLRERPSIVTLLRMPSIALDSVCRAYLAWLPTVIAPLEVDEDEIEVVEHEFERRRDSKARKPQAVLRVVLNRSDRPVRVTERYNVAFLDEWVKRREPN